MHQIISISCPGWTRATRSLACIVLHRNDAQCNKLATVVDRTQLTTLALVQDYKCRRKISSPAFGATRISLKRTVAKVEERLHAKSYQLDCPAVSLQCWLVTDGRTDGQTDRERPTANTALA